MRQSLENAPIAAGSAVKLARLRHFTEAMSYSDFTDGGSTTGTFALTNKIPAGAIFNHAFVRVPAGFAGDTSATLQIGDGSDVDRYSTGTPSVFAADAGGIDIGIPSGRRTHDAEATITLTVTSGADFTSVSAGQLVVTMVYLFTG